MFQVFDGEKPADREHCKGLTADCWSNSKFETWEEAVAYANKWLGQFGPLEFTLGRAMDYNGYGDFITIKEIL